MRAIMTAVMLCFVSSAAWAQSAEDTVAFLMFNLEDGAKTNIVHDPDSKFATWHKIDDVFRVEGLSPHRDADVKRTMTVRIIQKDKCVFDIYRDNLLDGESPNTNEFMEVDFSKVTGIKEYKNKDGKVTSYGFDRTPGFFCMVRNGEKSDCDYDPFAPPHELTLYGQAHRASKALEYFNKTYCSKAF